MIIDDLPSISIANDSDEIAIEQGTATKKITKGNFLQEVTSAISSLLSSLSGKVSKAGDTMTGDLQTKSSNIEINDASNAWGNASIYLNDKNSARMASVRAFHFTNGMGGIQLGGHNGSAENVLRLMVNSSGERSVSVSDSAAWRSALGLLYAANDTFSINSSAVISGFINNNSNTFWLEWSVGKSMENISTVTVTTMSGYAMGVNGGLDGSTSTKDYTQSPYSISVTKQGNYHIRIGVSKSSAFTNTTPLSPVTYFGTLALKFT